VSLFGDIHGLNPPVGRVGGRIVKLTRARITNYKSIDDSGWFDIENVTCLVGKNESGKTAVLHALTKLNPVGGSGDFHLTDYPRHGYVRYKRQHELEPAVVVRAEFVLSDDEISEVEVAYGTGILKSRTILVEKDYKNERRCIVELTGTADQPHIQQQVSSLLESKLPGFVYFDAYSTMRGRISIQDIQRRSQGDGDELDTADRTFLSLLSLVGADLDDLDSAINYEHIKAELESASISITDEVFEFWKQNRQIRVEFDISNANPNDPPPLNEGRILHVRIWNDRHRVSVPFDERSKGFVWFFSFLAYFSGLEAEGDLTDMVLLFDEPGLNLHATAQHDFLRFICDRLAPTYQVIYSTHSPFMIDVTRLSSLRTVEDMDHRGTVVTSDVTTHDPETVFPLQVALGYRRAQMLFLAPHSLLVKSPSDQIYLQILGELAAAQGHAQLDPRWVVIPVGGADNLPTLLSILGEQVINAAVMMDVTPKSRTYIDRLNESDSRGYKYISTVEVSRATDADLEDLFPPQFYLDLVNQSYGYLLSEALTLRMISGPSSRIVERISCYFADNDIAGGRFDIYRPAAYLLENHIELHDRIEESTVERAAGLFGRINQLLPDHETVRFNGPLANVGAKYENLITAELRR
jgi:predicted ATP-dependent endonuclease of OLD family